MDDDEKHDPEEYRRLQAMNKKNELEGLLEESMSELERHTEKRHKRERAIPLDATPEQISDAIFTIDEERKLAQAEAQQLAGEINTIEHELGFLQADLDIAKQRRAELGEFKSSSPLPGKGGPMSLPMYMKKTARGDHEIRELSKQKRITAAKLGHLRSELYSLPTKYVRIAPEEYGIRKVYTRLVRAQMRSQPTAPTNERTQRKVSRRVKKKPILQGGPVVYRSPAIKRAFAPRQQQQALQTQKRHIVRRKSAATSNRMHLQRRGNSAHMLQQLKRPNFSINRISNSKYKITVIDVNNAVREQLQNLLKRIPGPSVLIDGLRVPRNTAVAEAISILHRKNVVTIEV